VNLLDYQFEIHPSKVHAYLLNLNHPKGKSKAKWFINKGFDFQKLSNSLVYHGKYGQMTKEELTNFGHFITMEGDLFLGLNPVGKIRSVWELQSKNKKCRFVTAYPI
jgi:hypothetical protein